MSCSNNSTDEARAGQTRKFAGKNNRLKLAVCHVLAVRCRFAQSSGKVTWTVDALRFDAHGARV